MWQLLRNYSSEDAADSIFKLVFFILILSERLKS